MARLRPRRALKRGRQICAEEARALPPGDVPRDRLDIWVTGYVDATSEPVLRTAGAWAMLRTVKEHVQVGAAVVSAMAALATIGAGVAYANRDKLFDSPCVDPGTVTAAGSCDSDAGLTHSTEVNSLHLLDAVPMGHEFDPTRTITLPPVPDAGQTA